jgi:hypothetical protein
VKFTKCISAVALAGVITVLPTSAFASEVLDGNDKNALSSQVVVDYYSDFIKIDLPDTVVVSFDYDGVVTLQDSTSGVDEVLPTKAVNKDGLPVILKYDLVDGNVLVVKAASLIAPMVGWWDGVKCVAGTLGSATLGGLTVGAQATIVIPGIGTVSGLVIGAVAGGLVGIATFC